MQIMFLFLGYVRVCRGEYISAGPFAKLYYEFFIAPLLMSMFFYYFRPH